MFTFALNSVSLTFWRSLSPVGSSSRVGGLWEQALPPPSLPLGVTTYCWRTNATLYLNMKVGSHKRYVFPKLTGSGSQMSKTWLTCTVHLHICEVHFAFIPVVNKPLNVFSQSKPTAPGLCGSDFIQHTLLCMFVSCLVQVFRYFLQISCLTSWTRTHKLSGRDAQTQLCMF